MTTSTTAGPTISFPEHLPVSARRDEIAEAVRDHQVVVVAGETGSGKTTQLPKIMLALGRGAAADASGRPRMIGHTQPRRIAARSVAERIAEELGTEVGAADGVVGYQVRFTDRTSQATRVKVMTDGILLAELQRDPQLLRYDTLIIDEAHERSLNVDFLLGYLHRLLRRRPDLRLVITSATIETGRFARHFGDRHGNPAPVIEVSGRTYPVEVRYRPLVEESWDDEEGERVVRDQTEGVTAAVDELVGEGPGDVLVFLPGEREIRDTAEALGGLAQRQGSKGFDVLPLYARLSSAEQHRVFASHSRRRVVLATNIAETSLTVPGIRYVVDAGLARISRYSARTKVQRLPIEPVSRASANQRAGRCGRVEAGICIRLYSEEDYEARPEFTDPEILRTNLASVILQMATLRLGDVEQFGFLDPPDPRQVRAGRQLLDELGALTSSGRLTRLGRRLARLPVDPRLGRMVLEADRLGCLREVLVVVAALSLQDPRERPVEQRARADQLHARFRDASSDFLAWLNLWQYLRAQRQERSGNAFRRMCREEHLNYLRVREWQELEWQLRTVAKEMGLRPGRPADEPDADAVHQALLSGLLSHVGLRDPDKRDYLGARGTRFSIFPGSGLFRKQPSLVMAGELVETSRLWGRQVAAIRPEWAERLGAHLVKRQYAEPHWSSKRAAVMARERVTLYGVPLVADRLVQYGSVDPVVARELFVRHALVQGEWRTSHRFLAQNRRLLEEAEELEHRSRRRGLVVDEHTLFDFYDARVGEEVVSGAHFDTWWKKERRERPDLLTFDPAMLLTPGAEDIDAADYPDAWREGGLDLSLAYHFEPGADDDGVTVDVPVSALNQLDPASFTWQVPGLREELVVALLRSLPKHLRTSFVPAPDHARAFLRAVQPGAEPLLDALERHLRAVTGVHVPREAWDLSKVPAHLQPRFRVVDEGGGVVAQGRDLEAVTQPLRPRFEEAVGAAASEAGLAVRGATAWTFGALPEVFTRAVAGQEVRGWPAVADEGASVGVVVLGSPEEAAAAHADGVRRLLVLALPSPVSALQRELTNADKLTLASSPYASVADLLADCALEACGRAVGDAAAAVRDDTALQRLRDAVAPGLLDGSRVVLEEARRALEAWRETDRALTGRVEMAELAAMSDMQGQVARLVAPGFVSEAGPALRHYPRYLHAVRHRRERLAADPWRDRALMDQVAPLDDAWQQRYVAVPPGRRPSPGLRRVRWMVEELRVSLFAQQLGTDGPVSDARIRKALADL